MQVNPNAIRMTCFYPTNPLISQNFKPNLWVNEQQNKIQETQKVKTFLPAGVSQFQDKISHQILEVNAQVKSPEKNPETRSSFVPFKKQADLLNEANANKFEVLQDESITSNYPKRLKLSPQKEKEQNNQNTLVKNWPENPFQEQFQRQEQNVEVQEQSQNVNFESLYKQLSKSLENQSSNEKFSSYSQLIEKHLEETNKNFQQYLKKHELVEKSKYDKQLNVLKELQKESESYAFMIQQVQNEAHQYTNFQAQHKDLNYMAQQFELLKQISLVENIQYQCVSHPNDLQNKQDIFQIKLSNKDLFIEFQLIFCQDFWFYKLLNKSSKLQLIGLYNQDLQIQEKELAQFSEALIQSFLQTQS